MKRSGNRLLAMLLCVAMMLTLLPLTAFARWDEEMPEIPTEVESEAVMKAELPADAPEDDGQADLSAGTILTDGVTKDTWKRDEQTNESKNNNTGWVCEKTDNGVHLKSGSADGNANTADAQASWPGVYINETANAALAATTGNRWIEFTLVRAEGSTPRFGVILNYVSPADGYFLGCNADNGWFWEQYGGSWASENVGTTPAVGVETKVRIEWNDTELVSFELNGEKQAAYSNLAISSNTGKGVGFRLNTYGSDPSEYYIKEMHYSGQETTPVYDITGKVTDAETHAAVAGVKVTATPGGKTASTDTDGNYTVSGLVAGTYELSFAKSGYKFDGTKSVPVSNADVSGQNVAMTPVDTVDIPTDGAKDEGWALVHAGKEVVKENDTVVLEALDTNNNNFNSNPAIYQNTTMNAALDTATGEKKVSFTMVPEITRTLSQKTDDWVGFGFALAYNGQSGSSVAGYHIGYDTVGGWFVENYGGGDSGYPSFNGPTVTVGEPMDVIITWSDSKITFNVNGTDYPLPSNGTWRGFTPGNHIGFKAGQYGVDGGALQGKRATKLTLSNIHYSGQATIPGRVVKGTVTSAGKAVAGATVTVEGDAAGIYTKTTDDTGKYFMELPIRTEAYRLSATKDGYTTAGNSVTVSADADKSELETVNFTLVEMPKITGKVVDKNGNPVRAGVSSDKRPEGSSVTCDESGNFTIIGAVEGVHTLTIQAEGYEIKTGDTGVKATVGAAGTADVDVGTITLEDRVIPFYTLSTEHMDVRVAQGFPQVIDYKMKKLLDANGQPKIMYGQTAELKTIKINGVAVQPTVESTFVETDPTKVTYTMVVDDTNNSTTGVTATITAELRVGLDDVNDQTSASAGRTLGFYITNVEYAGDNVDAKAANRLAHPVDTIEIPNHSLVSVRSTEEGAAVTGGKLASNTVTKGDTTYVAKGNEGSGQGDNPYKEDFFAAFVYNNDLSAGLASNSAYAARGSAGDQCYPVRAQFEAKDGGANVAIGLSSTLWYYDHDITRDESSGDQKLGDKLTAEQKIVAPLEIPFAKVVIAGDENENGKVDWQDGAIAYRETVMHIPAGGESVADAVNLRISMNFGSMATNPFLIALDNVKRVAAHTDGLGQFVLLKGYAGEGHDSNHPQYDNIGIRMGGAEDMVTLISEGGKLGATFGIHTNASEFYAEAIENQNQVRRNTDGSIHYGWNWLDQGIAINGVYDYATGLQKNRWDSLYDIVDYDLVKDHPFVVYVDVWGNNTSGTENDFMTRALSQNIIGHNGWRIAHEWAWANPYESTFQHWVTDYTYGNYSDKGKLNSEVLRFILNQYKDSFTPDFATFGGSANAPLLGGPAMQGFEGWQGDGEYNLSIYNTFNQMVYTKFLQHYSVTEWTDAATAVKMPYSEGANGARSNTADWTPEVQLKLAGDGDEIVVTRGTSGNLVTDFKLDTVDKFLANETEYRSRVVTLNGAKIVEGAPASAGEDNSFPQSKATLKYLIPWYWDNNGTRYENQDDVKLYHWNAKGGQSTWTLQEDWAAGLDTVIVYELSDQGRGPGKSVKVINGKITLSDIKANTGYVVTRGAAKAAAPEITYGEGLHLQDPSFNLDTSSTGYPWTIEGEGIAMRTTNNEGISVLKLMGDISVSQELKELTAGQKYVTYMAVDNRSDANVTMTIKEKDSGKVVATNYTNRSIGRNYISSYYLHNGHGVEAGSSYFQNMYLYFTPESSKAYILEISHAEGSGNAYIDDIRTVEYRGATFPVTLNEEGEVIGISQDFENVPQGLWPFVVGPAKGVNDNYTHLSERNEPYTQAGWEVKRVDEVLNGDWSVKIADRYVNSNAVVIQTIPQNFHFESGSVYTVSFKYQLGSEGCFQLVVGDGANMSLDNLRVIPLEETAIGQNESYPAGSTSVSRSKTVKFTVQGAESGQTWIGIYSTNTAADRHNLSENASVFAGYLDFVLDDLTITKETGEKEELALLLQEANEMVQDVYSGDWDAFIAKRTAAQTVLEDADATTTQINTAYDELDAAMKALTKAEVSISGKVVKSGTTEGVAGVELTLENATYFPTGLTLTTGEDGAFEFVTARGVELTPGTYHIKAQATGYNVTTTGAISVSKENGAVAIDAIELEAEAPGAYVNDFNSGDVSMMRSIVPAKADENEVSGSAKGVDKSVLPTIEATEFNGSGALKITFNAAYSPTYTHADGTTVSMDNRSINLVVDDTIKMTNGSFSFDVTALSTGSRFNLALRVGDEVVYFNDSRESEASWGVTRFAIGAEDDAKQWFGQYWNEAGTAWSGKSQNVIAIEPGATRNVRVVMDGPTFTIYVDGLQVYDMTMPSGTTSANEGSNLVEPHTAAGYVGFNMRNNVGSQFIIDNIRIIRADTAEGVQNVSGTVTARSGVAISGAAVELFKGNTRMAGTTTNALGEYQISRVASGSYTMKVSAPFFVGKEQAITVASANLTGKDFTLIPDISSLTTLIAEVEALTEADYTSETWDQLSEALDAARAIGSQSTIAELNVAYRDLSNAKNALEKKPQAMANFGALRQVYNENVEKTNKNYTNSSWDALQTALEDARAILLVGTATQDEVDAAKKAIEDAVAALTPALEEGETLDLNELQAAYDAAKDVVKGSASDTAWERFTAARDAALAILSNADGLTQTDVDAAAKELTAAQSGLRSTGGGGGGTSTPSEATETETRDDGTKVTTVTKPDGTVTETVTQPDGTKSETVTAKNGDVTITVTDENGEELVKAEIPATIPEPETKFEDVDATPWAEEAIQKMAGLELVNGTGGNNYSPVAPMTRGSLATVLHRLSQGKTDYETTFKDVAQGKYYTEGVAWAAKAKVVTGYTEEIFAPDDVITREQLAVMLARYAKLIGMDTKADSKALDQFADGDSTGTWATDGVAWCVENGILKGKGQNNLDPTANVTRAEVAVMLDRFIALIQK